MPEAHVETERWFQLSPVFTKGEVTGLDVLGMTKKPPPPGRQSALVKITFRVPKRLFTPFGDVLLELDEDSIAGTPQVIIAALQELRDELDPDSET